MMRSSFTAVMWLAPAVLYWAAVAFIARIPSAGAIRVTNVLFILALPVTYSGRILSAVDGKGLKKCSWNPAGRMPMTHVYLAHRGRRGAGSHAQVPPSPDGGEYCVLVRRNFVGGLKRIASADGSVQALAPGLGSRLYVRLRTRRPPVA